MKLKFLRIGQIFVKIKIIVLRSCELLVSLPRWVQHDIILNYGAMRHLAYNSDIAFREPYMGCFQVLCLPELQ